MWDLYQQARSAAAQAVKDAGLDSTLGAWTERQHNRDLATACFQLGGQAAVRATACMVSPPCPRSPALFLRAGQVASLGRRAGASGQRPEHAGELRADPGAGGGGVRAAARQLMAVLQNAAWWEGF
eukprot:287229-Chlamydomonas_euryale.AAC.3